MWYFIISSDKAYNLLPSWIIYNNFDNTQTNVEWIKCRVTNGSGNTQFSVIEADSYFPVFELACKSKSPSIKTTALDCLQVNKI